MSDRRERAALYGRYPRSSRPRRERSPARWRRYASRRSLTSCNWRPSLSSSMKANLRIRDKPAHKRQNAGCAIVSKAEAQYWDMIWRWLRDNRPPEGGL